MQRISAAEGLAESVRVVEAHYQAAIADGLITEIERTLLDQEFTRLKRQARVVVAAQTLGIRIMRTAHFDKNLRTEIEAINRDEAEAAQSESRLLDFPTAAQRSRRREGGQGPNSAA